MIPVTQTKVVVKNSNGDMVVRGNCYAAAIASILEVPITEVPNVETLFHIDGNFCYVVMHTFLQSIGWELCSDDRYRGYHSGSWTREHAEWLEEHKDDFYFVSGMSPRGVSHICIYKAGKLVHDPHPTREGINSLDYFESLTKSQTS